MHTTAILVAAGLGTRLGGGRPKAFVNLAGVPLFVHSLRALFAADAIGSAVVVAPPGWTAEASSLLDGHGPWRGPVSVVEGGARRQDSVRAGLDGVAGADLVAVHDAARPFVSARVVGEAVRVADQNGAAIVAVRCTDTVKRAGPGQRIAETIVREGLWLAETPQVFRTQLLRSAHERAAGDPGAATDDAALVERLGASVQIVEGEPGNRKITTRDDLAWAEWALSGRPAPR